MPPRCQWLAGRVHTSSLTVRSAQLSQRTYATTNSEVPPPVVKNPLQRRKGGDLGSHLPKDIIPQNVSIPAYPYGEYQLFRQANKGLYGDQMIQFGNNVSKKTETKTRRVWRPNVLSKSLYSVVLKKKIKLRVTANVLKTIDREGGLDEYLLKDSEHRIKELGPMGWALRWTLMQRPEVIARLRAEAAALGIDQATIDKQWPTRKMMYEQRKAEGLPTEKASTYNFETDVSRERQEQGIWDPEDDSFRANPTSSPEEKQFAIDTMREFNMAVIAGQRYLRRGVVDSEEEGIKLAFVRAKEREDATKKLQVQYDTALASIPLEELEELKSRLKLPENIKERKLRKIAYNQRRRAQVDQVGGYEAWKEAKKAEWMASKGISPDSDPRPMEERKAEYAKLVEEAETATTNTSLSKERRKFFQEAINKANIAIKATSAGGKWDYLDALMRQKFPDSIDAATRGNNLGELTRGVGADGWGAVVDASNKSEARQPSA
ncbi:similar to 50S ribosomal protein L24 [Plenodomus lingam JN3]|uniref:Large ribosomal subunit protein bL28m n=2 Tax=Leptosphaeria maculans TaxID=5022 RepID=E4ZP49_LEPMJ|nr:similar to 50S ribosomal protein L24 [Plenodomus lingam JN3]CBX93578.1 similar to 50S ribosomal protein L24 [Plenodomus lingam JN3]